MSDDKEYRELIKLFIDENSREHKEFYGILLKLSGDISALKVKSGVWGLMGAAIPILLTIVVTTLIKR